MDKREAFIRILLFIVNQFIDNRWLLNLAACPCRVKDRWDSGKSFREFMEVKNKLVACMMKKHFSHQCPSSAPTEGCFGKKVAAIHWHIHTLDSAESSLAKVIPSDLQLLGWIWKKLELDFHYRQGVCP
jgi:hypothetical protein